MTRVLFIFVVLLSSLNLKSQNNCLHFDGANDFINFTGFNLQNNFTVSFWFKASEIENFGFDDRIISSGPSTRLEIGVGDSDCESGNGWLYDQSAGEVFCITIDLRDGEWHHMAFQISDFVRSVYVDGSFVGEYSGPKDVVFGDLFRIGQWTGGSGTPTYYRGYLDEVRIWDYALDPIDLVATMNCELNGNEEGLLAYWNFNQGNSGENNSDIEELLDLTSNEIHGELRNFLLNGSSSNFVESGAPITGACTTASSDLTKESIVVGPNPTYGKIRIKSQGELNTKLEILQTDGTLILSQNFNTSQTIDISDQNPGVYFVKLLNGEKWLTYRIVKL